MPSLTERFKNGWNAFINNKDPSLSFKNLGPSSSIRPDSLRFFRSNSKTIIGSIYNRIALDAASIDIRHSRVDENDQYIETIHSYLNDCLNISANIDQPGRAFIQDAVLTMFDKGVCAIVPTNTSKNPNYTDSYDVYTFRVGEVLEWMPQHVRIRVYNELTGYKEDIVRSKNYIALVQNPFYNVMNEPNSTLQRLNRKLSILDVIDEQSGSGKLDLIIQLPYVIKTEARKLQAEQRRKDIETQLSGSKYGIAYTDGTERITQLNRAVENNIMSQVEYLTNLLFSQLNITQEILNGTAKEEEMVNYYNRTIEPIVSAVTDEMTRKFLTPTARTQGQKILSFRDPFKLATVSSIADVADKFTRNEILSPNEVRGIIGFKPRAEESANELRNRNMPIEDTERITEGIQNESDLSEEELNAALQELDEYDKELDNMV